MLKLNEFEKTLINEISLLSGATNLAVREILEFAFLRQVEQYMNEEEIQVPFLGKLKVNYKGDSIVEGAKKADIEVFFSASDLLKYIVGNVQDGESDIIENLLKKKLKATLQDILDK
jgi:hypothetical protein